MSKYNYLIVGAGLFGSVFAQQAAERGKRCLVIERRSHVGGNIHCDIIEGIQVHRYGPHIFHTRDREVWDYVNRFARFNSYVHSPVAACRDGMYNLPLNMYTFSRIWGVHTPKEAQEELQRQIDKEHIGEPENLEEKLIKHVGYELYEKFYRVYAEKQWGMDCRDLPADASTLMPLRFNFDNHYYTEPYQGIPKEGYDVMIKRMLAGCEVMLKTEYAGFGRANAGLADKVIYTGMIDEFFTFKRGTLEYRTIRYQTEVMDMPNYQGVAVMNHNDPDVPYTRTIEHKHFQNGDQPKTVVTMEYPAKWNTTMEPYYPVNDAKNQRLYNSYRALAVAQPDMIFCGRLGTYRYYTMDQTVRAALDLAKYELDKK